MHKVSTSIDETEAKQIEKIKALSDFLRHANALRHEMATESLAWAFRKMESSADFLEYAQIKREEAQSMSQEAQIDREPRF